MCYAKPGPRCAKKAKDDLRKAMLMYQDDPSRENAENVKEKREQYYLTGEGIRKLKEQGKPELAQQYKEKREKLIAESNFLMERSQKGKWGQVPLKDMDAGGLVQAAQDIIFDSSINWGTSSPENFSRAISAATYWHMNQTRANRANYPRTPYIEHPLRNAIRSYRWGCTDGEVLTAIVLHDTLEDCADKIIQRDDLPKQEARNLAERKLTDMFGKKTAHLVYAVSNPIPDRPLNAEQKIQAYHDHVANVIGDPQVFIVKFADFTDNAGGLHHNYIKGQEQMVLKMYKKYSITMPVFKAAYERNKGHFPVGSEYKIQEALTKVEQNLNNLRTHLEKAGLLEP